MGYIDGYAERVENVLCVSASESVLDYYISKHWNANTIVQYCSGEVSDEE